MGIDRRLGRGKRLKVNEEGKRAAAPGWIAAPARASAGVGGPPAGFKNASVEPLRQHAPFRSALPSDSTALRSASAKRTHAQEVSGIAAERLPRLGGKISITCIQPSWQTGQRRKETPVRAS